jgi:hypothetical protein
VEGSNLGIHLGAIPAFAWRGRQTTENVDLDSRPWGQYLYPGVPVKEAGLPVAMPRPLLFQAVYIHIVTYFLVNPTVTDFSELLDRFIR